MLLPAAARTDERDGLAGAELEIDPIEDDFGPRGIGERDPLESHGPIPSARR